MRIFLKILGGIFALGITGLFVVVYNYNMTDALQLLLKGDGEAHVALLIILAFGGFICLYPITYFISNAIDEHF